MSNSPADEVCAWLDNAVVGLGLCPFAGAPIREGRVRVTSSSASDAQGLLTDLALEFERLDATGPEALETTLLVVENMLGEFADYNQFLDLADALLCDTGREGVYQIASFHPDYQFAGSEPGDAENLTNCAPWPVLHILREASLDRVLADDEDTAVISARNIETVRRLPDDERRRIFKRR